MRMLISGVFLRENPNFKGNLNLMRIFTLELDEDFYMRIVI